AAPTRAQRRSFRLPKHDHGAAAEDGLAAVTHDFVASAAVGEGEIAGDLAGALIGHAAAIERHLGGVRTAVGRRRGALADQDLARGAVRRARRTGGGALAIRRQAVAVAFAVVARRTGELSRRASERARLDRSLPGT